MSCEIHVGHFLVRRCGEPSAAACSKCAKQVCQAHLHQVGAGGTVTCASCATSNPEIAGWIPPAPSLLDTSNVGAKDLEAFSESDIAAFDEVSGADRIRGREVYDS